MHRIIQALLQWRSELQDRHSDPHFEVDVPTLNLGSIHGGDNPNRICAHCEMQIDIRPLPGMDIQQLRQDLQQRLAPVLGDQHGLRLEQRPIFCGVPPFGLAADSKLVQAAQNFTGNPAKAVAFGTEAPYLANLGLETIVLGPGDIDQAHQPNEYLALDRIDPYLDVLHQMVKNFCVDPK